MSGATNVLRRWVLALAITLVLVYVVLAYLNLWLSGRRLQDEAARVRREIAQLEVESRRLGAELAYYSTDRGIEELAREQLGLARPGETMVLFIWEPSRLAR